MAASIAVTKPPLAVRWRPAWWPAWLCLTSVYVWAAAIGIASGFTLSWWLNRPLSPWLHFHYITASYLPNALTIDVVGEYDVVRPCSDRVLWRVEAISANGAIARFVAPGPPDTSYGRHLYTEGIPLTVPIRAADWRVQVITACMSEDLQTVASPEVPVIVEPPWKVPGAETPPL